MKTKVFIAIPTGGTIRTEVAVFLLGLDKTYNTSIAFTMFGSTVNNRSKLLTQFFKSRCEWLLLLDADTVPPNNVLDMIKNGKDICSGVYHQWRGEDIVPLAFIAPKDPLGKYEVYDESNPDYLVEVDGVGGGCLLIHEKVFKTIKPPYFIDVFNEDAVRILGNDLYFCKKAKKAGFKIWIDRRIVSHHFKTLNLKSIMIWKDREVELGIKRSRGEIV